MRVISSHMPGAGGVLSAKVMDGSFVAGYRLECLPGGESAMLAMRAESFRGQFPEACRLGPYVFSGEAFALGCRALLAACADPAASAVFLDEAGPLELRGEGFAQALPPVLRCGKDVYVAVRDSCVEAFLRIYEVQEYELIRVDRKPSLI